MRKIGLEDVSYSTKIHLKYLRALESDDLEGLPGKTFAKGFVNSYARAIGLDVDEALLQLEEYVKSGKVPRGGSAEARANWLKPLPGKWRSVVGVGMLVLFLLALFYFRSI